MKMENNASLLPKTDDILRPHIDSKRWDHVKFRHGDILLGTYVKSGTTWIQQIIRNLIGGIPDDAEIHMLSPWVEYRVVGVDAVFQLEKQTHRRFMKHHLPQQYLPTEATKKAAYIYVARDGRDVAWSFYNHHGGLNDTWYERLNSGDFNGPPIPVFDADGLNEVEYFRRWLDRDGYPIWPFWSHIRSWWRVRNHPRVLLVHFNNLKKDLPGEITRIYRFLKLHGEVKAGTEADLVRSAAERSTFQYMKKNADRMMPGAEIIWKGGGQTLINKGTNGRWKDVMPGQLSDKYTDTARLELGKDCAHWLATGEFLPNS